jgi:hypothetical protein
MPYINCFIISVTKNTEEEHLSLFFKKVPTEEETLHFTLDIENERLHLQDNHINLST